MGEFAAGIMSRIHSVNPYENFDYASIEKDLRNACERNVIQTLFNAVKPRFVVEVGSWKGDSALMWASLMKKNNIDGAVLCIDTWLGGIEHLNPDVSPEWRLKPYYKNGYPTLYYRFLANVMHMGLQDYIVPFATTSLIGARFLGVNNLAPNLIYIDASHDEDDVYQDVQAYWKILNHGGVLCGDDFRATWYGVICAVNRFAREQQAKLQQVGENWVLQKTVTPEQQTLLNILKTDLLANASAAQRRAA
jgi:predicted O-methyltransferase YrrM